MRPGWRRERGFTLLEVLVAFIIAALALGELFSVAASDLHAVAVASRTEEAISRAQSHLAAIDAQPVLVAGEQQGEDGGGYHWAVRVAQRAIAAPEAGPSLAAPRAAPPALYLVTAVVSWREGGQARSIRLTTERVAPAAPAVP